MYQAKFGIKDQVCFDTAADYYEFLGYLAKNDGTTKLVWERNNEQGAWGNEGRIHFYEDQPKALNARLSHTAGTGNIISRVNCNDFFENIVNYHGFKNADFQDIKIIKASIPRANHNDFDRGLAL